jgi:type IV pilus assembly protein PilY1
LFFNPGWRRRLLNAAVLLIAVIAIFSFIPFRWAWATFDPAQHQKPVVAMITPVLPNVFLVMDNSGSMRNLIWENGYDANHQYPLYRWGRKGSCSGSGCSGNGSTTDSGETYWYGRINFTPNDDPSNINYNGGTREGSNGNGAWFCYRGHPSYKGNLEYTNPNMIVQSDGYIWGRKTNSNNTWVSGEPWRKIKLPVFSDPVAPSDVVRYTDNYLAYLFEKYTTSTSTAADLSAIHPAKTRMMVAREVVNALIQREHLNARFGLMTFNNDNGGLLGQSLTDNYTSVMNKVSNVRSYTWTPLGETLQDTLSVFQSGIQYQCQNNFVVLMTDGEPAMDLYYDPATTKSDINTFCDSDSFCQALKAELGYTGSGFPWYHPCTNCRDTATLGEDTTLLDGIAYWLNRMVGERGDWPQLGSPAQKCKTVQTYTIGFAIDHPLLSRTAKAGDAKYFTAQTANELADALDQAMQDIFDRTFSVAGLAFSSPNYRADETRLVSTRFNSADWSGDVISRNLSITWNDSGAVVGSAVGGMTKASDQLPVYSSRAVYTVSGGSLVPATAANTGLTTDEFNYLMGDSSKEARQGCDGCSYRDRLSLFGDVVDSRPAVANGMVYVGANDGFLHAIDLNTMTEAWTFIPPYLLTRQVDGSTVLKHLMQYSYTDNHLYYVDLSLNVHTFGGSTYLVGGLRGGGKEFFCFNITNPQSPSLVWKRSSSDTGWASLGYSFSEPQLTRLLTNSGGGLSSTPVLIIGNGYGVDGAGAAISDNLLIVSLTTGGILYNLATGTATGGLTTPAVYGPNGWIRAIYAGDMAGNLWRFSTSIENPDPTHPPVAQGGFWYVTKLYSAGRPITAQCNIGECQDKPVVISGTGRYLMAEDINDTSTNKFFAVRDLGDGREVGEGNLWYLRTFSGGDRITTSPEIVYGRAYAVVFKPDNQACSFGGNSKICSFKFCPDEESGGAPPSKAETQEQTQNIGLLITSNLGTTGDSQGNSAVIAEDVDGNIHVFGGEKAPASLSGWKTIRWQQVSGQGQ